MILYNPIEQTTVEKSNCTLSEIIIKVSRDMRSPRDALVMVYCHKNFWMSVRVVKLLNPTMKKYKGEEKENSKAVENRKLNPLHGNSSKEGGEKPFTA